MKTPVTLSLVLATLAASGAAFADPPTAEARAPGYTTRVVDIVGRRAQPVAAVEVTRAAPRLALHELTPSFALGIETGVAKNPF